MVKAHDRLHQAHASLVHQILRIRVGDRHPTGDHTTHQGDIALEELLPRQLTVRHHLPQLLSTGTAGRLVLLEGMAGKDAGLDQAGELPLIGCVQARGDAGNLCGVHGGSLPAGRRRHHACG